MLTMNYQDLQYKYSKGKKKKQSQLKDEKYKLTKKDFSASTWKDYKEWLKEQKIKTELQEKHQNRSKSSKGVTTKVKVNKSTGEAKNGLNRKERYYKDLTHPLWLKKRAKILDRDNHQCILCHSDSNLCVHHTKYSNGKKAWQYPNSVLVTLCKECHHKVHQDKNHELNPYK